MVGTLWNLNLFSHKCCANTAQSPSRVVLFAKHSFAPKLALGATPLAKTLHRSLFASLTQRATLVGLITRNPKGTSLVSAEQKNKAVRLDCLVLLCYLDRMDTVINECAQNIILPVHTSKEQYTDP